MQNTVLPEDFQEDTSHLNSPAVRDASASHSDNEEQDTSASHSHTDEDEEKNIASNIEKSWKTIEECIHKTNFSTSKKPSKSRKPSSRNQEKFGYKLRDFFPPDMRKGCKKDTFINKAHPVDNQRSLFASTTITNLKKEVEKKISDETQITKAYGIITEFLLNDEIFYLPKTLLHQILNFPVSRKYSSMQTYKSPKFNNLFSQAQSPLPNLTPWLESLHYLQTHSDTNAILSMGLILLGNYQTLPRTTKSYRNLLFLV